LRSRGGASEEKIARGPKSRFEGGRKGKDVEGAEVVEVIGKKKRETAVGGEGEGEEEKDGWTR